MRKYLIGCCPECNAINAAAIRTEHDTDVEWNDTALEFGESGLLVSEIDTAERVTIDGCSDTCKTGLLRKDPTGLLRVEAAIRDYHYALDTHQHGGVAQDKAIKEIESALNLHWRLGEELARRKAL